MQPRCSPWDTRAARGTSRIPRVATPMGQQPAPPNGATSSKKRITLWCERTGSKCISWCAAGRRVGGDHARGDLRRTCPVRRYDPTPHEALDRLVRAACAVGADEEYVLCDDDSTPLALSSALPDGLTLELCHVAKPAPPLVAASALAAGRSAAGGDAIVIIDPCSTGAVIAHHAVTRRRLQVVAVWSDGIPDELCEFVAGGARALTPACAPRRAAPERRDPSHPRVPCARLARRRTLPLHPRARGPLRCDDQTAARRARGGRRGGARVRRGGARSARWMRNGYAARRVVETTPAYPADTGSRHSSRARSLRGLFLALGVLLGDQLADRLHLRGNAPTKSQAHTPSPSRPAAALTTPAGHTPPADRPPQTWGPFLDGSRSSGRICSPTHPSRAHTHTPAPSPVAVTTEQVLADGGGAGCGAQCVRAAARYVHR